MDELNMQVRDIIFRHLNKLEAAAIEASRTYGGRYVHKTVVSVLIMQAMCKYEAGLPVEWVTAYNTVLTTLVKNVIAAADSTGRVKIRIWKNYIQTIKNNFIEGQNENN